MVILISTIKIFNMCNGAHSRKKRTKLGTILENDARSQTDSFFPSQSCYEGKEKSDTLADL